MGFKGVAGYMGVVKLHPGQLFEMAKARAVFSSLNWSGTPCMPASRRLSLQYGRGTAGTQPQKLRGAVTECLSRFQQGRWSDGRSAYSGCGCRQTVRLSTRRHRNPPAYRQARPAGRRFQRGGEIGFAEVLVDHVFPALLAQLGSRRSASGVITRQFVNFAFMTLTGDNAGGSGGIIRAGGGGDFTLAGGAINTPCSAAARWPDSFRYTSRYAAGRKRYQSRPASARFRYALRPDPAAKCRHAAGWYRR